MNKLKVIKRDGRTKDFDFKRIMEAVRKAYLDVSDVDTLLRELETVDTLIQKDIYCSEKKDFTVEDIQDIVIKNLKKVNKSVAEGYEDYRNKRTMERDKKSELMGKIHAVGIETDRDNANVGNNFSSKLLRIASESNKWHNLSQMPQEFAQQHINGDIHIHDLDSYNLTTNCLHIPTKKVLMNGFNTGYGTLRRPNSIESAGELSCILLQSTQNDMFGGQSHPNFDNDLGAFVNITREKVKNETKVTNPNMDDDTFNKRVEELVERHVRQAMQGIVYNLNTMHARAGSQVPFSSVNIGLPTNDDDALVCKIFLEEYDKGLGKGEQCIFPNIIMRTKKGVNRKKEDPYHYLYKLACKVASKRMNPTFMNIDADFNKEYYDKGINPATMGCVDGYEIITYKINDKLHVESFERMWNRLANIFEIKQQELEGNYYIDLKNIYIYDTKKGFVKTKRIIRNKDKGDWNRIKFSNGRSLLATSDHPLPIIDKGRIFVKDLKIGHRININQSQYSEETIDYDVDKAWMLGFILCDGCYDRQLSSSIAETGEDDIEDNYKRIFKNIYDLDIQTVVWHREERGNYKELKAKKGTYKLIQDELLHIFEGKQKKYRHIPNEVFSWNRNSKLSFLAGMIDADGYINSTGHCGSTVQIGSTNKELALQTMALSQSLGLPTKVYLNHYTSKDKNKIRYRIEFTATVELLKYMVCQKKINCFDREANITNTNEASITSIEFIGYMNKFSYDVTTDSDFFEVSGIYSHNCRTYLMSNINGDAGVEGRGNIAPVTINLPRIGIKAKQTCNKTKDRVDLFFDLFESEINLCRESLLHRYEILKNLKVKDLPFVAGQGLMVGAEGLQDNDSIEPILKQGTWGIGFIGLAETLIALTGKHHGEDLSSRKLGIKIITYLRNKCDEFKEKDKLNWSAYASPAEGLSGRFIAMDKKKYGVIEGITDKDYYSNSFHVPVYYAIPMTDKIQIEAPYHKLCNGGHISYVEVDGYPTEETIMDIIDYAYDNTNINYLGINFHIRYCRECGTYLNGEDRCPKCDSTNIQGVSRVTGYLSLDERFGGGKKAERQDRTSSNGNKVYNK